MSTDAPPQSRAWLCVAEPGKWTESKRTGAPLPPLHSARYAPCAEAAIETGVAAIASLALELMPREGPSVDRRNLEK